MATDRLAQPTLANGVIATLANLVGDPVLDCAAVPVALPVADGVLGIGALAAAAAPVVGTRVIKSGWKTGVDLFELLAHLLPLPKPAFGLSLGGAEERPKSSANSSTRLVVLSTVGLVTITCGIPDTSGQISLRGDNRFFDGPDTGAC